MRPFLRNILIFALLPLSFGAYTVSHSGRSADEVSVRRSRVTWGEPWLADPYPAQMLEWWGGVQFAIWEGEVGAAVLIAQEEERARQAAIQAAQRARQSTPAYHPGSTVGECTGFAIPAYIIQRESGGNPSAYNPSGAYGCAQTLLSHYSRGQCVGLDPYTIDGQRECVWRLSNGGTNLAPWAATR